MTAHPALQDASATGAASPEAVGLAVTILAGDIGVDEAVDLAARHLLTHDRVDVVLSALTRFQPQDTRGWKALGARAWIREWTGPQWTSSLLPPHAAGPEAALTMPWLSRLARSGEIVVIMDSAELPEEVVTDLYPDVASLLYQSVEHAIEETIGRAVDELPVDRPAAARLGLLSHRLWGALQLPVMASIFRLVDVDEDRHGAFEHLLEEMLLSRPRAAFRSLVAEIPRQQ